jgi:thymidylate synthase
LEPGDNGPGSYGAAFHDFPTPDGAGFNQFLAVIEQMKDRPELKTHIVSPWIPFHTFRGEKFDQKVVICPCHGWCQFTILNGELYLYMTQRSGDFPIGVPNNMIQYFALLLMVAQVLGIKPAGFIHNVVNAHVYEDQIDKIDELISRKPYCFPTLKLNADKDNIFDYRQEDFELEDYYPHSGINFPATV